MGIFDFFKPKATLKKGFRSEFDKFYHGFNQKRSDYLENPLRDKEINKHDAIFSKRDKAIEDPESKIWKDF